MFAYAHKKGCNPSGSNSTNQYLNALIENSLRVERTINNEKRPLQLRFLPEILSNFAAMVTAEICVMPRNVCKPLTTSRIWGEAKPLSGLRIKTSCRFLLTRPPALTGAGVGAITSIFTIVYSEDRGRPDNSHLSPDK
jgi:hypothetical protein